MKSETQIVSEICEELKANNLFFWRSNNVPVMGRAMPKFAIKGLPDIFVVVATLFIAIEVKRPEGGDGDREPNGRKVRKGVLSPDQAAFATAFTLNGGNYMCVRSLEEVINGFRNLDIWLEA